MLASVIVQPALANITLTTTAVVPAFTPINLAGSIGQTGYFTSGNATFFVGGSPAGQGFVQGASSGNYAVPVDPASGNPTSGPYLSTGTGTDVLTFSTPLKSFTVLWGSVDSYNSVNILGGGVNNSGMTAPTRGMLLASFTGTQALLPANGNQGQFGSVYATFTATSSSHYFNQIEFVSTGNSFEATNFSAVAATPEPGFFGLMTLGFAGLAGAAARRRKQSATTV